MSLRLRNRLSHPIPYPGAELIPYQEPAIIEEPDLTLDTCLQDFGTDYFIKYCPSSGSGSTFHSASRSSPMAPLPPVRALARLTNAVSPFPEDELMLILQPLISSISHSQSSLNPSPGSPSPPHLQPPSLPHFSSWF